MVIKNLTSKMQKVSVKELTGEHREYDIYIHPESTTDVDRMFVLDASKYKGIIEVVGECPCCHKEEPAVVETPVVEAPVESPKEETPVEEEKAPVVEEKKAPDNFVCDICGAEFASARGLASHKNKVHAE